MNLTIISPDLQINADLENRIRDKFANLEKIYNRITGYEIKMRKMESDGKRNCVIEGRALLSKNSFFCREQAETLEQALDQVIENLTHQLKWQNEKRAEIW